MLVRIVRDATLSGGKGGQLLEDHRATILVSIGNSMRGPAAGSGWFLGRSDAYHHFRKPMLPASLARGAGPIDCGRSSKELGTSSSVLVLRKRMQRNNQHVQLHDQSRLQVWRAGRHSGGHV